jgi:hypothetical protein
VYNSATESTAAGASRFPLQAAQFRHPPQSFLNLAFTFRGPNARAELVHLTFFEIQLQPPEASFGLF